VSEQFLNGTAAQYRLCSAILLKLQKGFKLFTIDFKTIAVKEKLIRRRKLKLKRDDRAQYL